MSIGRFGGSRQAITLKYIIWKETTNGVLEVFEARPYASIGYGD